MIKQELIHVHGLLFEARVALEKDGGASAGAFASYDAQPVRPPHINRGKEAHREAITLLLQGFSESMESGPPRAPASPA